MLWRTLLSTLRPCINSRTFKKKQVYHFNMLKCNLCFIINIWQKFKSYSGQFQSSNLHNVAEGTLTVFLDLKTKYDYRFMKDIILFFNCCMATQQPTLGHCWGSSLANSMLITAFATYLTQRSLGVLLQGCVS